jgi:hypothetical protein
VLSASYASAFESTQITLLRVHKPDGTTVDTPTDNAIEMSAEITRDAPLYSDLKEKHLPVRSLSVGDVLEYEVHTLIEKPQAPDQFWGAYHFTPPGSMIVLQEVLNLEVPKDKYVRVWCPNHKPTVTEHDAVRSYSWNVAQLVPPPKTSGGNDSAKAKPPKDPDKDDEGRKLPSVAWTTFRTWAEVGAWYKALALPRAQPAEALRSRAEEITKDAKTPEDQVRAIYEFVSSKYRYVGIDFGVGRYHPHDATEVMANQYGDCKDKDTLLEALLRSRGFVTAPALIGAGIAMVSDVPSPAMFNHVITTVDLAPGRIWLDSTPGVGPFRYLSSVIRDQTALLIPASGTAALVKTPASGPYPFTQRFEATATLDGEGKLSSRMSATYHDDSELLLRTLARSAGPADWDKASQLISAALGFGGKTSNSDFKNIGDLSLPIVLTYDYQRHPFGDWNHRRIVPLLPTTEFPWFDSENIVPTDDIELGAPRTMVAISRIRVPERYGAELPRSIHVKTDFATFDKTYRFDGKEIVVERAITILKNKVPGSDWKAYQNFTRNISLEGEAWIQLIRPTQAAFQANRSEDDQANASSSANDAGAKAVQLKSGTRVLSGESGDTSPEDTPPQD